MLHAATHTFIPKQFYTTFSGTHPVALRIKPGDRVITKTIDAGGKDWNGKSLAERGNPETGPFYIEGAEPGDAIVVTFETIETNRTTAFSGSLLAPYTVDPAAIAARVDREPRRVTWNIDKARGVARLVDGDIQPGGIELPLKPMLGCIGVAPERKQAIATSTPGNFGGLLRDGNHGRPWRYAASLVSYRRTKWCLDAALLLSAEQRRRGSLTNMDNGAIRESLARRIGEIAAREF